MITKNIYLNKISDSHIVEDWLVFEGDTASLEFVFWDTCLDTGLIQDLTGWTFELVVRDRFNNIVFTETSLGTHTGVIISVSDIDTTQYPSDSYRYSIRYLDNSIPVNIKTFVRGNFIIKNAEHL